MTDNRGEQLVKILVKTFDFYSEIYQIGDVIENNDREFLVLGIERVRLFKTTLVVHYICQNLTVKTNAENSLDFSHYSRVPSNNYTEMRASIDLRDIDNVLDQMNVLQWKNIIPIGSHFTYHNRYFRWIRYKSVEVRNKELIIHAYSEEIKLANPEKIRQKLLNHKKEKMNFTIV